MMIEFKNVLFPTDFSTCASAAQKYALQLARKCKAKLHVIHVVPKATFFDAAEVFHIQMPDITAEMEAATKEQLETIVPQSLRDEIDVEMDVLHGVPYQEIIRFADEKNIDVIVIATHGRTGLQHLLLGGTADKVIHHSPCPVFSVRHPDTAPLV